MGHVFTGYLSMSSFSNSCHQPSLRRNWLTDSPRLNDRCMNQWGVDGPCRLPSQPARGSLAGSVDTLGSGPLGRCLVYQLLFPSFVSPRWICEIIFLPLNGETFLLQRFQHVITSFLLMELLGLIHLAGGQKLQLQQMAASSVILTHSLLTFNHACRRVAAPYFTTVCRVCFRYSWLIYNQPGDVLTERRSRPLSL